MISAEDKAKVCADFRNIYRTINGCEVTATDDELIIRIINGLDDLVVGVKSVFRDSTKPRLLDVMSLDSNAGDKVRYAYPEAGYTYGYRGDLVKDEVYTVQQVDIGQSCSEVELVEFPGRWYNTVMFAPHAERDDLHEHREL